MWQALRNEYHPKGFELVTVGLDTLGGAGCRGFIEAAKPQHPSLIDQHHVLADLFGVINIPSSVWIDEHGIDRAPGGSRTGATAARRADRSTREPAKRITAALRRNHDRGRKDQK